MNATITESPVVETYIQRAARGAAIVAARDEARCIARATWDATPGTDEAYRLHNVWMQLEQDVAAARVQGLC